MELDVNTKEETDSSGNKADNKAYRSEEELEFIVPLYKQYGQYIKASDVFDSLKANQDTGRVSKTFCGLNDKGAMRSIYDNGSPMYVLSEETCVAAASRIVGQQ